MEFRNGNELDNNIIKTILKRENKYNWIMYLVAFNILIIGIYMFNQSNTESIFILFIPIIVLILYFILKSNNNNKLKNHNFEYKYCTVSKMYLYSGKRYAVETTDNENYLIEIRNNKFNQGDKIICIKYSPSTVKVYKVEW